MPPNNQPTLWGVSPLDIATVVLTPPPPPDLVLPGLQAATVGLLFGGGGGGKSFLTLHIAAAVASGQRLFDAWDVGQGPVVVVQMEDDADEVHRRIAAINRFDNYPDRDIYLYATPAPKPRLLTSAGRGDITGNRQAIHALIETVQSVHARLLIIDPLIRTHALEENANSEMIHLMDLWDGLARATGAAVLLVHHSTKAGRSGSTGDNSLARGAGVLTDEARWVAELGPLTDKEAQGIPEADRWKYLALRVTKCNYGPRPDPLFLYRTEGGALMRSGRPTPTAHAKASSTKGKVVPIAPPSTPEPDMIPGGPELDQEEAGGGVRPDWL